MKRVPDEHYFAREPTSEGTPAVIEITFGGRRWRFHTLPGVFSRHKVDEGSLLLAETLQPALKATDCAGELGCGYGFPGLVLAPFVRELWLVDVNRRALELARRNCAENSLENVHVVESDVLQAVPEAVRFDVIFTNPPFRAGKQVVQEFCRQAHERLAPDGRFYVVVRKRQGAGSLKAFLEELFGQVETLNRHKGYHVLAARRS